MRRKFLFWIFLIATAAGCYPSEPNLSALAPAPDWAILDNFQETMTRREFMDLLEDVFTQNHEYQDYISIQDDAALLKESAGFRGKVFKLRFAKSRESQRPPPRSWRANPIQASNPEKPLLGLRIALDPGHIGGSWSQMEKRWFRVNGSFPVAEGDLTLEVAKRLAETLSKLGAEVFLVRQDNTPVTADRPETLHAAAEDLVRRGKILPSEDPFLSPEATEEQKADAASQLLFYRVSEIRARARLINERIKPDLVLCLHFNAENWGDPNAPKLVNRNHLHVLVNGAYTADELALDDVRLEMLLKLLSGAHAVETAIAEKVSLAMARRTGLLPCYYPGLSVRKLGQNPYLWARNLLANRIYQSPVVYLEPYVMNDQGVFMRIQAGDYEGERRIAGKLYPSLFREYASGVAEGLLDYYRGQEKGVQDESNQR